MTIHHHPELDRIELGSRVVSYYPGGAETNVEWLASFLEAGGVA